MFEMRLLFATIEGYKRFADKTTIRLDDRLIAIVGPNEAGKTSLLRALASLDRDGPFDPREKTRGAGSAPKVVITFTLDDADKAALSEIPGGRHVKQFSLYKDPKRGQMWIIVPRPSRNTEPRKELLDALREAVPWVLSAPKTSENPNVSPGDLLDRVLTPLDTEEETLPSAVLADLAQLQSSLANLPPPNPTAGEEFEWAKLADTIAGVLAIENEEPPARRVLQILDSRRPRFVLFNQADRDLASSYNLDEVAGNPPPALLSLARLADLDLPALHTSVSSGDFGRAEHLQEQANKELLRRFSVAWEQSEITVRFRLDDRVLRILISLPGSGGYSAIEERSDGLLWFVSLYAFLARTASGIQPVLLVDEAETHLHYDAQADLVQVMNRQKLAHSIIYTTHSAGCLPPDLGRGIRIVVPDDGERSHLENSFWGTSGAGYRPLLMAMGASVLAFSSLRYALIGEGPVEAILLPALIREATGIDRLEYQVAPGLAVASDPAMLGAEAARVAYIVDGDSGGDAHRQRLLAIGIDPPRILSLGVLAAPGVVLEDLVDDDAYAMAVNEELARWKTPPSQITAADIKALGRPTAVSAWCKTHLLAPPSKVGVANRIVDMWGQRPLVRQDYGPAVRDLDERVRALLGIK